MTTSAVYPLPATDGWSLPRELSPRWWLDRLRAAVIRWLVGDGHIVLPAEVVITSEHSVHVRSRRCIHLDTGRYLLLNSSLPPVDPYRIADIEGVKKVFPIPRIEGVSS